MISHNNMLFIIGGGGLESNISNCEKYNIKTNEWIPIAGTPSCRHALSVVKTKQDTIYAVGGYVNGSQNSNACERYDINKNEWIECASMKVARRLFGLCYHHNDESIYTFGGSIDDGQWYTNAVECYSIQDNQWTQKKPLPLAGPTSSISVDGYIYVFVHGKNVLKYNPLSDDYEVKCNLPLNDWNCFSITSFNNLIFVCGGATKHTYTSFWSYNTSTNQWKEMPSMLKQRRRAASSLVLI
jgi:N-acetylneuraminic acid mutarotase